MNACVPCFKVDMHSTHYNDTFIQAQCLKHADKRDIHFRSCLLFRCSCSWCTFHCTAISHHEPDGLHQKALEKETMCGMTGSSKEHDVEKRALYEMKRLSAEWGRMGLSEHNCVSNASVFHNASNVLVQSRGYSATVSLCPEIRWWVKAWPH